VDIRLCCVLNIYFHFVLSEQKFKLLFVVLLIVTGYFSLMIGVQGLPRLMGFNFFRELLLDFYSTSGRRKPENIIIFRYFFFLKCSFC